MSQEGVTAESRRSYCELMAESSQTGMIYVQHLESAGPTGGGARARHIQIHVKCFETYKSEEDQKIGILFETRALRCHRRHPPILIPGKWTFVINEVLH